MSVLGTVQARRYAGLPGGARHVHRQAGYPRFKEFDLGSPAHRHHGPAAPPIGS